MGMSPDQIKLNTQGILANHPYLPGRLHLSISVWYNLSWGGWFLTAVLFMIEPSMTAIPPVVASSLIFSLFVIMRAPLLGLYLLPLPMMIGPIYAFPVYGIGSITSGDLYSLILITRSLFLRDTRNWRSERKSLFVASSLLLLSSAFSYDLFASLVGLAKIFQYAFLIRATIILIKKTDEFKTLCNAWVFTSAICCTIMLWHFYCGRPSLIFWLNDLGYDYSIDLGRSDVFFRPTYFYANIFVPIGLSLIYTLITILTGAKNRYTYVLLLLTIPVNLIALTINNIRSMIVPVFILCGWILLWYFWNSIMRKNYKMRKFVFVISVACLSLWLFFGSFINTPQRSALMERALSFESVVLRLSIWESVLGKVLDNPFRLLIGWGPQATVRQYEKSSIKNLLTGTIGNTEGAFDSTIVGSVVEYGIILSTLVFVFITIRFLSMLHKYRVTGDVYSLSVLTMAITLIFCHVFQQFSINPPGLMALQVFAIEYSIESTARKNVN
jgi:hypothetical protein